MGRTSEYLWYIKERVNPQLGTYFVPMGQLSKAAAKRAEGSLYGSNHFHSFSDQKSYLAKIEQLKKDKETVHEF